MSVTEKCYDKTDHEITPGSIIVYGHNLGRCAGLRIGKVKRVKFVPAKYRTDPEWRLTVRGIEDDWTSRAATLCKRDGTLMFPNRCLVLDPKMLTDQQRHLLSQVTPLDLD